MEAGKMTLRELTEFINSRERDQEFIIHVEMGEECGRNEKPEEPLPT